MKLKFSQLETFKLYLHSALMVKNTAVWLSCLTGLTSWDQTPRGQMTTGQRGGVRRVYTETKSHGWVKVPISTPVWVCLGQTVRWDKSSLNIYVFESQMFKIRLSPMWPGPACKHPVQLRVKIICTDSLIKTLITLNLTLFISLLLFSL